MPAAVTNDKKDQIGWFINDVIDGTDQRLVWTLLQDTSLQSLDALQDHITLDDVLDAGNEEVTAAGYGRIVEDGGDVAARTVDNTGNDVGWDHADLTFGSPNVAAGENVQAALLTYVEDVANIADPEAHICLWVARADAGTPTNGLPFHARFHTDGVYLNENAPPE